MQSRQGEKVKGAAEVGNWVRRRIRTRTREGIVGRNIILCFDGTNDEYSAVHTNVVRLYTLLDRNRTDQLAYYQPGIGTFAPAGIWGRTKRRVFSQIDLAIGWFLKEHVTCGYRFLMRYYQPSDNIFIFGFSRGAYTGRVLVAMLNRVGLLTAGNEELIAFAWKKYRTDDPKIVGKFRESFSRPVKVRFIGVWDTVSSIGWPWRPRHLPYTGGDPSSELHYHSGPEHPSAAEVTRHAMALDERRGYFAPDLWLFGPADSDILQVWFPGVHSDVGGGYEGLPSLSMISLKWMVREAEQAGVHFLQEKLKDSHLNDPLNVTAKMHESLTGVWRIVDFLPQRIVPRGGQPYWTIHRGKSRTVPNETYIHESVFERQQRVPDYRPENITQNSSYKVVG